MENPEKISGADAVLINEVIKQFPYFQTAHLLYAKALHNNQHINYNSQLKTTAIYASDRKVLYRFITNKKNEQAVTVDEILLTGTPDLQSTITETKTEATEKTPIPEIIDNTQDISETTLQSKEKTEEITLEDIELDYLDNAAANIYSEKLLYDLPETDTNLSKQEEKPANETETKPAAELYKEPESFADWLTHLSDSPLKFAAYDITSLEQEKLTEKSNNKLSDFELIDKFIQEEPKISRPKAEFYNPVNMAKQSVTEDISFVSETLAKIYELQGNYSKALAAYESLRLKYPEKKLYFAAQIKNIKKIINQNNIK